MNIFDSYIAAGQQLAQREKEQFYTALIEFVAYGREPELKGAAKAVFIAIRPSLEISMKRAVSGQKGGLQTSKAQANANFATKQNASKPASKTQANGEANGQANSKSNSNKKDVSKDTSKKADSEQAKPVKHSYGENGNVLLTDDELSKLKEKFPDDWQQRIDDLSFYIGSTGKTYKSHYLTILNWERKNQPKGVNGNAIADKYRDFEKRNPPHRVTY